jgi:hypothetical protein
MLVQNIFRGAIAIALLAILSMPSTSAVESEFTSLPVPETPTENNSNSLTAAPSTPEVTTTNVLPVTSTASTGKTSTNSTSTKRPYYRKGGRRLNSWRKKLHRLIRQRLQTNNTRPIVAPSKGYTVLTPSK